MPSRRRGGLSSVCGPVGASCAVFCTTEISSGAVAQTIQSNLPLFCAASRCVAADECSAMTRMPSRLHHRDDAFGEVLVGLVVGVDEQGDLDILPPAVSAGKLTKPSPSVSFRPALASSAFALVEVERIVDRRRLVVERRAGIEAARIDGGERSLDQRVAEVLPVDRLGDRLAEVEVAVELADRLRRARRAHPSRCRRGSGRSSSRSCAAPKARRAGAAGSAERFSAST